MNNKAFTLIELLVAVLIIGILAAIAVPQYQKAVYKSHYNKLMDITNSIHQAEEVFYLSNGRYTDNLEELDINLSGCTLSPNKKYCTFDWGICDVFTGNYGKVTCLDTQNINNAYVRNFSTHTRPNKRTCYAFNTTSDLNSKWSKICKDAGATEKQPVELLTCSFSSGNRKCNVFNF